MSPYLDIDLFETLIDRLSSAASTSGGRHNIAKWIEDNTSDPINMHKPWSFNDHEFQIAIVESKHPRTYVLKASQIGVSEIMVRLAMALLAKMPGRHCIYTLPDANFARKFAPSRFDPVIAASKKLALLNDKELSNNEIKKFASSYLYVAGANKESQSISIPASMMFNDEVAYSNQEVIGTFNSRLGHLKQGEEIVYAFSTPLLPNSDISRLYESGTKDQYLCYHTACNQWQVLDPLLHIRIPNFKTPIELFSKEDLLTADVDNAYVECPHCKQPISIENLSSPQHRAWVPEYPDRYARSFDANFLVLPQIRPPSKVLKDRANYRSTGKWVNFAIGRPADSSDARITSEALDRCFQTQVTSPKQAAQTPPLNTVIGMDVGKTGHLVVARKHSKQLEVIYTETPRQDENNNLALTYAERHNQYRARMGVIDAGPEFTVTTKAQTLTRYGTTWGCYFTRGNSKSNLEFYEKKEADGVILVQRTKAFDEFVSDFNAGHIVFPKNDPNEAVIRTHLRNLSRVSDLDALGTEQARWVSTGEDHFLFATFYAWVAADLVTSDPSLIVLPQSTNFAGRIRMKV